MEFSLINGLVIATLVLLVLVTGGVGYLTAVEWRDRRRQDREKRGNRVK
ncbi:MAG: hypothetical protein HC825_03765 [Oscillatoriales cyanobacterium RM1_1_9]|nr:hypothetical protein [Oscillatoriales cyanobacterium SM2_3_0]NJO45160.1 hypothetical protein [Oscillatoriales cyanobacterium RM2_1_1]NJO71048.1 hypothetical protein [Oscillatoriales cyanobacterium RM1_1_9]